MSAIASAGGRQGVDGFSKCAGGLAYRIIIRVNLGGVLIEN
jgi:hypothetical protein